MADLAKKAKVQQWLTAPANLGGKVTKNPLKIMLLANEDDNTPISILTVNFDPVTGNVLGTAAILAPPLADGSNLSNGVNANNTAELVVGQNFVFNGSTWDRERDTITSRTTSATHAAQTVTLEIDNLHDILNIVSVASGGTATLDVQASVDNSNFIDLYSLATAATNTFSYVGAKGISTGSTAGAADNVNPVATGGAITETTLVSPLGFKYLKVVAGDPGVGNTTTLTVAVK